MKPVDCSGLACPGPVIQVKKAMEELSPGDTLEVKVDSDASLENVRRFVESRGGGVRVKEDGESGWFITIVKPLDSGTRGHGDAEKNGSNVQCPTSNGGKRTRGERAWEHGRRGAWGKGAGRGAGRTRDPGLRTRDSNPGTRDSNPAGGVHRRGLHRDRG